MKRLLLLLSFVIMAVPAFADKGGRPHNANVAPTGIYGQDIPRVSSRGSEGYRERSRNTYNNLPVYTPYKNKGRHRAAIVSKGKHKGWYKQKIK